MKMQKSIVFTISIVISSLLALPAFGATIAFSTGGANDISWTITVTGGSAVLSFDNIEVDTSVPSPDPVLNDFITLPDMAMSDIIATVVDPDGAGPFPAIDIITATLTPVNVDMSIIADVGDSTVPGGTTVLSATVKPDSTLAVGTSFIAYSGAADDLDLTGQELGYSDVIDEIAAAENAGYAIDLSFGGSSEGLFDLLSTLEDGSVSGTLSGQIVAIPEPLTLSLLGLGGIVFLRRRK